MSEPLPPATPGATAYGAPETTVPAYSDRPVAIRGPESLGGLLLILAGLVAAVSLVLDWLNHSDVSGWGLVRKGFDDLGDVFSSGLWQPLVIVLGGGLLFLLGLALWLPARSHRFVGVVALIVSLAITAAVLVPLADAKWKLSFFGPDSWCAIAVAVLGLVGSLKAVLTRSSGSQRHHVP
jgi:UDP-N-acetylmuramyl pentapeptide phosphotransferase/UDP-N-acetylglucosamine-1-phosphate transferase